MPPSRHQTPSHTSHKPPYHKERAAGGMKGPSRQSSIGSNGATGLVGAAAKSSPDKKPVITQQRGLGENEDAKMDKKRRKKARRERESNVDVDMAANVKAEDQEVKVKEEKVVTSRPLAPTAVVQGQNDTRNTHNQTPSQHQATTHPAPKHGITNNASHPNKPESRSNKLELKVEKQKMKLKEAEARAAADAERSRKDTERIKELEESVKEMKDALEAKEQAAEGVQGVVEQHLATIAKQVEDKKKSDDILIEAVSCPICSDTLADPHILSCGHTACRDCLKAWFRTTHAYPHKVSGDIPETRDMSYRSKICHVCRSTVLRRPTRMYNVYSFLEDLGPLGEMPLPKPIPPPPPSQEPAGDPWENLFPPDRQTYKLHDEEDDTYRCPACLHEIFDDRCDHCDAEFSGSDDNDEFEMGDLEFEEDDIEGGRAGGMRRARVNIAHVDEVFGDSEDDDSVTARRRARRRRQDAEEHGMFFDDEAEDVDQDMDGSGSESEDSGTSEFARPRSNPSVGSGFDYDSDPLPPAVGQAGGSRQRNFDSIYDQSDVDDDDMSDNDGAPPPRARQRARRTGTPVDDDQIVRRARQAVGRVARHYMDSEADDESDDHNGTHDMRAGSVYDSEEDDGSVPRPHLRRYARPYVVNVNSDGEEEEEEDEDSSAYEDSFIDDEVEEDGDEGSNDTENENHAEEMIPLASSDHEEEREEDGAGQVPNVQEVRRRRLQALVNGMNARGNAGRY